MLELAHALSLVVRVYTWIIIASAASSWLISLRVINPTHPTIAPILTLLDRLTEPLLRPIRRILPSMGGLDLSPIVLIFALWIAENLIWRAAAATL